MMKKVSLDELRFGMFVSQLDRPWTDTPFMFQGFLLKTPEQMEVLHRFCKYVFVDTERVEQPEEALLAATTTAASAPKLPGTGRIKYTASATVESEFSRASDAYASAEEVANLVIESVGKGGMLDVGQAAGAARSMSDSIKRNPDALVLLSTLK